MGIIYPKLVMGGCTGLCMGPVYRCNGVEYIVALSTSKGRAYVCHMLSLFHKFSYFKIYIISKTR